MQERFETFTVLIAKINRSIRRLKTEEMAEFHLKSPHVSCLYYLYKEGPLTSKELCDVCDEDKAALSRSIDHLESCGYITCGAKNGKRYKASLSLTPEGERIARHIAERIDSILTRVGNALGDEGRAALYRGLTVVSEDLQTICDKYED